jgi:xylose isomerase
MTDFFKGIPAITYEGEASTNEFAFRHYNPDEMILGKRMEEHMRFAVAYWHSFAWPGGDPFGGQTFDRPWFGDSMDLARMKADVAFEMFDILGVPFYCFHDADMRPEGATFADSKRNLDEMVDYLAAAVGHLEPVQPPALDVGRGHQPRSRCLCLCRGDREGEHGRHDEAGRAELCPVGRARRL